MKRVSFRFTSVWLIAVCLFSSPTSFSVGASSKNDKPKSNVQDKQKPKLKEIRKDAAVTERAKELRIKNKGVARAMKHLEDRGFKQAFDKGVMLVFEKPKNQTASRHRSLRHSSAFAPQQQQQLEQPIYSDLGDGTLCETTFFSYNTPPEKWVGVMYDTTTGTGITAETEVMETDQIVETLSEIDYDDNGNMIGQWYNADYYDLSAYGYYTQGADYYAALEKAGLCAAGCSASILQNPVPAPGPTPRPTPAPCQKCPPPVPQPHPTPPGCCGPPRPLFSPFQRCWAATCLTTAWGCRYSGPLWPKCLAGGCIVVSPLACVIMGY